MFIILGADEKEYGPVTPGHVIEWIRDGRANLATKAKRPGDPEWRSLGDFAEFNARAQPPVIKPVEPSAPPPVPDDEIVPASLRWRRLPAALIDGTLKSICYLPITVPLARFLFTQARSGKMLTFSEISTATNELVNTHVGQALPLLGLLVAVQLFLLTTRGQSVGKYVLGLRIVRIADNAPAGFRQAFLLRGAAPFVIEQIPVAGFFFWMVDSAFIFRADQRCVHDLIAGTKVVRV